MTRSEKINYCAKSWGKIVGKLENRTYPSHIFKNLLAKTIIREFWHFCFTKKSQKRVLKIKGYKNALFLHQIWSNLIRNSKWAEIRIYRQNLEILCEIFEYFRWKNKKILPKKSIVRFAKTFFSKKHKKSLFAILLFSAR